MGRAYKHLCGGDMSNYLKQLILLIVIPSFLISCTEEPANDPGTDASPPDSVVSIKGAKEPTVQDIEKNLFTNPALNFEKVLLENPEVFSPPGEVDGVGSAEQQVLQQKNLNKPIQYGVGAAGITMDTTFAEAKNLLTIPIYGPDEDGQAYYREELVVIWKDDGDRKPQMIIPVGGYLGTMSAGKFGELSYQTKFLDYKNDGIQGAARLTLELYLELEEVVDQSYNCLASGRCRLIYGDENQKNFVMVFPGAVFLMAKEEFQLAEIRLIRDVDPGVLANDLDLKSGEIFPPEMASFQLGETKKEIFDRINETAVKAFPEVFVSTDSFTYAWNGVYFLFHRSNYDNNVTEAEDEDLHFATQMTPLYPGYLLVDGKRVIMTQTEDDIRFDLEVMPAPESQASDVVIVDEFTVETKLTMNTKVRKQDSILFTERFADFLASQMTGEFSNVRYRTWGIQNPTKNNREISVTIEAYQDGSLKGQFIGFQVSEEQEKMDYVITGLMDPEIAPFSKVTLPASEGDVERLVVEKPVVNLITGDPVIDSITQQPKTEMRQDDVYTKLAGIKLNDLIKLEEIDALGRGEATVTYMGGDSSLGEVKERAGYAEEGTYSIPLFN